MSTVCTKTSHKKVEETPKAFRVTPTHLQWTQDGKKAPAVRVAHPEVTSLFFFGRQSSSTP
ncbi:hypothetical protein EDB86DRAFT_2924832 [Lactarius hatsudake]|nr:hypothetical protein EDB86DRAFT_2924832 [Lactarius hatsudake]